MSLLLTYLIFSHDTAHARLIGDSFVNKLRGLAQLPDHNVIQANQDHIFNHFQSIMYYI